MNEAKKRAIEKAGFKVGTAEELLGLEIFMTTLREIQLGKPSVEQVAKWNPEDQKEVASYLQQGLVEMKQGTYYLTKMGYFQMVKENPNRHMKR